MSPDQRRIVIVDPARVTPEIDCFNVLSTYSALPTTYHLPALFGPGSLVRETGAQNSVAGIIVLGSAASVHDRQPWQSQLESWLMPFVEQNTPVLGICYGHQMLARMFGGEVSYVAPDQRKLRGFFNVEFSESRLWPAGRRTLLRSHCEHVTRRPEEFTTIAASDETAVDAIQHRQRPIWGIQTHPEATINFLDSREIQAPQDVGAALKDGATLMKSFMSYCHSAI